MMWQVGASVFPVHGDVYTNVPTLLFVEEVAGMDVPFLVQVIGRGQDVLLTYVASQTMRVMDILCWVMSVLNQWKVGYGKTFWCKSDKEAFSEFFYILKEKDCRMEEPRTQVSLLVLAPSIRGGPTVYLQLKCILSCTCHCPYR